MSSGTMTQTQTQTAPRGGRKGRGRGGRGRSQVQNGKSARQKSTEKAVQDGVQTFQESVHKAPNNADSDPAPEADDGALCWICAEPVKYWSLSECNHRTCHVCALRLRALYKKQDCTFCKESQPSVIFTTSPDALWSSYTPDQVPYKDPKLSISFETQEMMEDTLILLRFNCPDKDCDYIANGWSDLKLHTRAAHGKLMCDICIRFKKIFAHEHALYAPDQLPLHLPSMQRGRHPPVQKHQIEGGVHPLCEFCRECFFGDDELYAHMREKHEECFICKRNEVRDQYFRNYDTLEQHFTHAHFPCNRPECLQRKFVVFGTVLDLKAHMVEEHGADMSARDKKAASRVQAEFEFEEVGSRRGRGSRRDRDRDPPPAPPPPGPPRPTGAGGRRREAFGGNLTTQESSADATPHGQTPNLSRPQSRRPSPSPGVIESGAAEHTASLVARISSLAPHPTTAIPAIQAAMRSYRVSESAARDLISTVWNIIDRNLDSTASVVNLLVDSIDEEDKKRELLAAWNSFKIEQRGQFPELVPTSIGTQWAGVTSGRVLNAKNLTSARTSSQSSRQVWDRVARAAASSSTSPSPTPQRSRERFPTLPAGGPSTNTTLFRQAPRSTPWASAAAAKPAPRGPTSIPGPGANVNRSAPTLSRSAFPELPTASKSHAPKAVIGGNKSLRNIIGDTTPPIPAWSGGGSTSNGADSIAEPTPAEASSAQSEQSSGKGKKAKGKQKQTLFTLGSFPA
ncbi:hypothetical protein DAEQUDRAFT_724287 [Daedalea quercina L-15889]|uniref:RING-type E3 ubiquitin transferase n=1 Tax=Daedalea quercina L-15889 TaxID=1314783 RepID=A0A165RZB2_9APHY|nr:hypothetical protein DAEQUDRAFT_724287 [Daedalea quercina L-15889]